MLGFKKLAPGATEGRRREAGRKVAVVTGASSGIGRAIALGCAREGADLAVTYRGNDGGSRRRRRAIRAAGPPRRGRCEVDISRDEDVERLARRSGSASGGSTRGSTTPAPTS